MSECPLFTHKDVEYNKDDYVALLGANSTPWIGQIISYEPMPAESNEDGENSPSKRSDMGVRVFWAWFPEEFKSELFPDLDTTYYSRYEVILSKFSDINHLDSIIKKITILPFDEFLKLNEFPIKIDNVYNIMFYRQTFDDKGLAPLLPLECNALFGLSDWKLVPRNPDLVYYRCKLCNMSYQRPVERIYKDKPSDTDFPITCSNCLSQAEDAQVKNTVRRKSFLAASFSLESHRKRTVDSDDSESELDYIDNLVESGVVLDKDDEEYRVALRLNRRGSKRRAGMPSYAKMRSLDRQIYIAALDKMKECLTKGVYELKAKNVKLNVNVMYLAEKIAQSLIDMYGINSREFKQRLYEIYTNLKRDMNSDLRRRVICGQLPINKLITMDTRLLAPPNLIAEREKERDKHFARNVVIPILSNEINGDSNDNRQNDSSNSDNKADKPDIDIREYHIDVIYSRALERLSRLKSDHQKPFRSSLDNALQRVKSMITAQVQ